MNPIIIQKSSLLSLVCACLLALAAPLHADQTALATAIQQTRNETITTHNELVSNLKALDALIKQEQGDLRPAFDNFRNGLTATRSASERTTKRVATLAQSGEKYFATWQAEVEQIKNGDIRERAVKRLQTTKKSWEKVSSSLQAATVKFPDLLGYLADIEKAMSYDLNADGVKSIRGASRSATDAFGTIQSEVATAVKELEQMAADMSSVIKS